MVDQQPLGTASPGTAVVESAGVVRADGASQGSKRATVAWTPIADHAFLPDRHSAALIDRAGSFEWLCLARFDSPTVPARLLDVDAGRCRVRPDGDWQSSRRCLGRPLVLLPVRGRRLLRVPTGRPLAAGGSPGVALPGHAASRRRGPCRPPGSTGRSPAGGPGTDQGR